MTIQLPISVEVSGSDKESVRLRSTGKRTGRTATEIAKTNVRLVSINRRMNGAVGRLAALRDRMKSARSISIRR